MHGEFFYLKTLLEKTFLLINVHFKKMLSYIHFSLFAILNVDPLNMLRIIFLVNKIILLVLFASKALFSDYLTNW